MIKAKTSGDFNSTLKFLNNNRQTIILKQLLKYGNKGVAELQARTPVGSGETADSWYFEIESGNGYYNLVFKNSSMAGQTPVVILLEYGHGTRNGGWVEGLNFINPAIGPILQQIADDAWAEVTR